MKKFRTDMNSIAISPTRKDHPISLYIINSPIANWIGRKNISVRTSHIPYILEESEVNMLINFPLSYSLLESSDTLSALSKRLREMEFVRL